MVSPKFVPAVHINPVLTVRASKSTIELMVQLKKQMLRDAFSERLKRALANKGIPEHGSGVFLKQLTGVTDKATSKWLNAESMPGIDKLPAIARGLGVRTEWLHYGTGPMTDEAVDNEVMLHETEIVEDDGPLRADEVMLPCFREVEFAAGDGMTQVIENHGATMRFSLARLSRAGVQPINAACATVSGTSMEPAILDGSPIAIDKGTTAIKDGDIYALDHGGMLRVKRLYRMPLNRVRIVSENADEYPEEIYSLGDPEAPRVIGRVFWWETFA